MLNIGGLSWMPLLKINKLQAKRLVRRHQQAKAKTIIKTINKHVFAETAVEYTDWRQRLGGKWGDLVDAEKWDSAEVILCDVTVLSVKVTVNKLHINDIRQLQREL